MQIDRLDHLVLTVADLDATRTFYTEVLGMRAVIFEGRHAVEFGRSKINLHEAGHEFEPRAERALPGTADVCFIVRGDLDGVIADLDAAGVPIEEGPVERAGALGQMRSVYIRDPDRNLVELSQYLDPDQHR